MNILEYAEDVSMEVSEIIDLCKKLGIKKSKEDDFLTDEEQADYLEIHKKED